MNFKKINKQLNKVKNLIDNIAEDDHVSPIEQHLLQSYIRDLYELTLSKEEVGKQKVNLTVMDEVEDVAPVVQVRKTTQIIEPTPVVVAPVVAPVVAETSEDMKAEERSVKKLRASLIAVRKSNAEERAGKVSL